MVWWVRCWGVAPGPYPLPRTTLTPNRSPCAPGEGSTGRAVGALRTPVCLGFVWKGDVSMERLNETSGRSAILRRRCGLVRMKPISRV